MKKGQMLLFFLTVLMLMILTGCTGEKVVSNDNLWKSAMADAVFSEDAEVHKLVTLTREDPHVIWDDAGKRVLLLSWHNYAEVENWNLRFAQLLGVHEDEGYTRFSAFWVAPEDVIRPAYITDVTKQMKNDYTAVADETYTYKEWFDKNILWSYFESDYPWTRLGYTYDWSGGESEYGLTEFLVSDGSKTEIAFTCSTEEFVDWLRVQLQS